MPCPWCQPSCSSSQAGANINAVDKQQRTPLMEAVVNNHLEVARYMVQLGGCVYSKVWGGAVRGGARRWEGGRMPGHQVPAEGLTGSCLPQEEDGSTCLHHAAKIGNLEMVSLLLSTGQVDVNAQVGGLAAAPVHRPLGRPLGFSPHFFLSCSDPLPPLTLLPSSFLWFMELESLLLTSEHIQRGPR